MTFKREKPIVPVIWVVVADRSRARILSAAWPEPRNGKRPPTWSMRKGH